MPIGKQQIPQHMKIGNGNLCPIIKGKGMAVTVVTDKDIGSGEIQAFGEPCVVEELAGKTVVVGITCSPGGVSIFAEFKDIILVPRTMIHLVIFGQGVFQNLGQGVTAGATGKWGGHVPGGGKSIVTILLVDLDSHANLAEVGRTDAFGGTLSGSGNGRE